MKYLIIAILVIVILIIWIVYILRKKWAIKKVKCTSKEEKLSYVNAALNPFGFTFDEKEDIVISKNNAWQRDFGYSDLYDLKAPSMNIVMHAEPIFFHYDCKEYRIEFWKGQYGITTGAEIGIYVRDNKCKLPKNFYRSATDEERLEMGFELLKNCTLFTRKDLSWWLTGFDVGMFSKPKDLQLKCCLKFKNCKMQKCFINGLLEAGYSKKQIKICDNIVCFEFCHPHNYKLNHGHKIRKCLAQIMNYINCSIYMCFTKCFPRTLDKLTYLRFMFPCIYRWIIRICIPRRKQKKYCKKK